MSYISGVQLGSGQTWLVGSGLYGVCNTPMVNPAKEVILNNFDKLLNGVTVHVKFAQGNTAPLSSQFTLQVGSTLPRLISNPGGSINWSAGAVISFTYDGTENDGTWIVNDSDSGVQLTVEQNYNPQSTNPISGKGVANALSTFGDAAKKDVIEEITQSNKNSDDLPTTEAVTTYVDEKTEDLKGAMHYRGKTTTAVFDGRTTANVIINGNTLIPVNGDVVLTGDHQEYIWNETNSNTHAGYWELLGDEGTYALNSSTGEVIDSITFSAGSPTEVTMKQNAVSVLNQITNSNTARAASAVVENGILKITTGILQTFGTTSIHEVDTITPGVAPTLSSHTKEVIVPYEE